MATKEEELIKANLEAKGSGVDSRTAKKEDRKELLKPTGPGKPKELYGTGYTERIDWGNKHGQWRLTLWDDWINCNSQVFVSATEWDQNGCGFVGDARYTVHNIAPFNGGVTVRVNIEWGSDIRVRLDYLVINP